jgi:hypothetical protein
MRALRFPDLGLLLASMLVTSACGGGSSPVATPEDDDTAVDPSGADDDSADDDDDTAVQPDQDAGKTTVTKPPPKADASIDASTGPKTDAGVKPDTDSGTGGSTGADGGGGDVGPTDPGGSGESSCLDSVTDYTKDGPFKFAAKSMGAIKFWVPDVPAGCKVPVVHLANGTGASCSNYQPALDRLASHGFLTACYEDTNTGAGTQGVMAYDAAFAMFPDLAAKKIGSTGHSQGGQAAFTVLALAEAK